MVLAVLLLTFGVVEAGADDNVSGYAWSENIGWISFNCINQGTCTTADYGVDIAGDGDFSGYAWSENIGWIDFAPEGPYPASPNYSACLDLPGSGEVCDGVGNYLVSGWARVLSYDGGWLGWIKLRGDDYGVSLDKDSGKFQGFSWSDQVLGWLSFKGAAYGVITSLSFNQPPDKPLPVGEGETWNHCSYKRRSIPIFHWTYSDPDGDPQAAYEVEVDSNSSFKAPKFNHLVNLAATSYALDLSQDDNSDWIRQLNWNTTYFWRVRVKDDQGNWSVWSRSAEQFKTPNHAYPWPDFSWEPEDPSQGEIVIFDPDISETFGGTVISSYLWVITAGEATYVDDTNRASQYPHIIFDSRTNRLKLRITDSDGYFCECIPKGITAQLPLPEYREVPPITWLKNILAKLIKINIF